MLLIHEDTGIRILGKMAMNKMVISHAFDTEVKFAASANPLTSLPGNVVINVWLKELLHREEYSIAYIDHYGFSMGDDMIRLVAEILSEQIQTTNFECRLGPIGGCYNS